MGLMNKLRKSGSTDKPNDSSETVLCEKKEEKKYGNVNDSDGEYEGGYMFISHSHKDLKKVRILRNDLEEAGFEPLCFYLKCLTEHDEIEGLIKREIDAREWFIYADSPNSRASEWVRKEREYIDSLGNKKTLTVDLESETSMHDVARRIIKGLRVNLIYSVQDIDFIHKLSKKLIEKELQVTTYDNAENVEGIIANIKKASENGANIIVLSKNSANSKYLMSELDFAFSYESLLLPVIIDIDLEEYPELQFMLINTPHIYSKKPLKDEVDLNNFIDYVVDEIWNALKRQL